MGKCLKFFSKKLGVREGAYCILEGVLKVG